MAIKVVTIGSAVNAFRYDDAVSVEALGGTPKYAIMADDPIKIGSPIEDGDGLRLGDVLSFTVGSKITADSITLSAGTTANVLADLQTLADGNVYNITEAAATPGIDLIVDFVNVTDFSYVQIVGKYVGALTTHAVSIQLYNWSGASWDTLASDHPGGINILDDLSFVVPNSTNYIGTGGNDGDVRVRFNHTMAGNVAHNLYLDVVALY